MAVKPETQAERLLAKRVKLEEQIAQAKKKAGIPALEKKLEEAKEALTTIMVDNEIEQVEGEGVHATLVRQSYGSMFVATDDDLDGLDFPEGRVIRPLRALIKEKFGPFKKGSKSSEIWKRVTKPVVKPDAIEEIVAEGLFTVDEIAPSFIDKQKKPYARVFKD